MFFDSFNSSMLAIKFNLALSISDVSLKNEGYNNLALIKIFLFTSLKKFFFLKVLVVLHTYVIFLGHKILSR